MLDYNYVLTLDDDKYILISAFLVDYLGFYLQINNLLTDEKRYILNSLLKDEKISNKESTISSYVRIKIKSLKLLIENVQEEIFTPSSFRKDPNENYNEDKVPKLK